MNNMLDGYSAFSTMESDGLGSLKQRDTAPIRRGVSRTQSNMLDGYSAFSTLDSDGLGSLKQRDAPNRRGVSRTQSDSPAIPFASDLDAPPRRRTNTGSPTGFRFSSTNRGTSREAFSSFQFSGGKSSGKSSERPALLIPLMLLLTVAVGGCLLLLTEGHTMTVKTSRLEQDLYRVQATQLEYQQKAKHFESLNRQLQNAAKRILHEAPAPEEHRETLEELNEYKQRMHTAIQVMSRHRLQQKFGKGPHRVEIRLQFDQASNVDLQQGADRFVIELAPDSEMPHFVYWFLEQAERRLFDGATYHRDSFHVIHGDPISETEESGSENVLFPEHSSQFTHERYTLGYNGRPGGPDFYINLFNNIKTPGKNHGPGGHNDDADPCFAKIVDGFDAVERMQRVEYAVKIKTVNRIAGDGFHPSAGKYKGYLDSLKLGGKR
jgi:cyclophilin family peptidyl-prolyl cis-trans isomerase